MNKNIITFALSAAMFFSQVAIANSSFDKLKPSIIKEATSWVDVVVTTLANDQQLSFLNLFALNPENSIQTFVKCAEFIESQSEMKSSYEQLSFGIIQIIKKYIDAVQAKIAQKKNISKQQEEKLLQKLEAKTQELIAYITAIYYQMLYKAISEKSSSSPLYMFDENGVIPVEKRTKQLPLPTNIQ